MTARRWSSGAALYQWPASQAEPSLCRGSAPAGERVQTRAAGQVGLKLKTPCRVGTMRRVMSPLRSKQRLAPSGCGGGSSVTPGLGGSDGSSA